MANSQQKKSPVKIQRNISRVSEEGNSEHKELLHELLHPREGGHSARVSMFMDEVSEAIQRERSKENFIERLCAIMFGVGPKDLVPREPDSDE